MLKKSLFEVHKAERRGRILAAARRLIARRGVDGLTLRDLAEAGQVSVPTVYNLIGSKQALLAALLEQTMARIIERLAQSKAGDMVERALALGEAGWSEMTAEPGYFRELVHAFLVSEENAAVRRQIDQRNIDLMEGVLRTGQRDGELCEWADPHGVACLLFSNYIVTMLRWASGELDDESFPNVAKYGMSLILLGLARGQARQKLEHLARELQHQKGVCS